MKDNEFEEKSKNLLKKIQPQGEPSPFMATRVMAIAKELDLSKKRSFRWIPFPNCPRVTRSN